MRFRKTKVSGAYTSRNKPQLVRGGSEYFTLLCHLIDNAKTSVHLQTYIYVDDETGNMVANHLIEAAKRGVQVYLVADGYASQSLLPSFIRRLEDGGVHFRHFEPLFKSAKFYLGRRLHHKVVVVDGFYSLVGGMNIADRYNDIPGTPAWLDMALYVEGEASAELDQLCCEIWNGYGTPKAKPTIVREYFAENGLCSIRVRRNDWVKNKNQVWKSYYHLFNTASESIIIMCSYFLPGWRFRKKMVAAIKRGVNIKCVVAGLSDVAVAKYAERYLYSWLLENNIEIYEYQKSVLHAKVAVRDCRWMTIGSFNVNNISTYASLELNLDVRNRPFVQEVTTKLESIIQNDCIQITKENYSRTNNLFKQSLQFFAFQYFKLMLFLFTFYFRREREN